MVWHTVWFKFKDGTTETQKQDMMDGLNDLTDSIDAVQVLACGENFSTRASGYEVGLVVTFSDRQGLEDYGPNPYHQNFVAKFKPLFEDVLSLDFETP